MEAVAEKIEAAIRKYFKENNFSRAVIGLSGGLDSSLSALLASKAIGSKNLTALILPEQGVSSKENLKDAAQLAKKLQINYIIQPINKFLLPLKHLGWKQNKLAEANLSARVRALLLYNFANSNNALVIGTGNRSELLLGYFTKHGDSAADLLVLGDLWKTEAKELAKEVGLPERTINKKPSAELYKKQTDEAELGATYEQIDPILKLLVEEGRSEKEIIERGFNGELVKRIIERVKKNEHKRKPIPIIRCKD